MILNTNIIKGLRQGYPEKYQNFVSKKEKMLLFGDI